MIICHYHHYFGFLLINVLSCFWWKIFIWRINIITSASNFFFYLSVTYIHIYILQWLTLYKYYICLYIKPIFSRQVVWWLFGYCYQLFDLIHLKNESWWKIALWMSAWSDASFTREASFHYVILVDLILSSLDLSNQTRFGFLVLQVNAHVIMLLASALWNILVTSILLWKLMGYSIFRITPAMFTCSMTLNLINLSSSEINKIWLYLCQTPTE